MFLPDEVEVGFRLGLLDVGRWVPVWTPGWIDTWVWTGYYQQTGPDTLTTNPNVGFLSGLLDGLILGFGLGITNRLVLITLE